MQNDKIHIVKIKYGINNKIHSIYKDALSSTIFPDSPTSKDMFVSLTKLHNFMDPSGLVVNSINCCTKHIHTETVEDSINDPQR